VAALFSDQSVLRTDVRVRILAGVTAVICWETLAFQFALILRETTALQASGTIRFPIIAAVAAFLSFLTFHINAMAGVVTACAAVGLRRFEQTGRTRSAIAAYMIAGSIVFILALQPYWNHRGAQLAADILLHYLMPILYIAFWLLVVPKERLRWRDPFIWLIYPGIYIVALLIFASLSGFYPYPLIDMRVLGTGALMFNLAALMVTFLASGFAVVAVARAIATPNA
jgi:hypothetical protein